MVYPSHLARCHARGLTLVEILIAMAILVLLVGVGAGTVTQIGRTQVRTQTNRIAAAIRHAYNRSAAHGLYLRMVFDLDAETYWAEASDTPVFLSNAKRTEGDDESPPEEEEPKAQGLLADSDGDLATKVLASRRQSYIEDGVIPKVTLTSPANLYGVRTTGQDDTFRSGKAYVHFFPNGFVEPAMIYVSDGEDNYFTLTVNPLTGKVTRSAGLIEPNAEFGQPDRVEEEEQ